MHEIAHFWFLLIFVRPSTLSITIYAFHCSITASAYVATLFYRAWINSYMRDRFQFVRALAISPPTAHLAPSECLKARFLGQSNSIFILFHRLYRWIAQNSPATICRLYTALYCSLSLSLSLFLSLYSEAFSKRTLSLSTIVLLTFRPGSAIMVWLSSSQPR